MGERKPGGQRVKFGQLAECVNDRVDDPSQAGVDRYVGLEHLDPESLTIRRWSTPDQVESTKLRFRPGDIIFGKRRAYQRKLAVADFEGICSAHAMVLRARPDVALPEFLPFFMQSDTFMERAQAISVGSLSPTINWKTLAAEEFSLPPLNEQLRFVQALAATEAVVTEWRSASSHIVDIRRATFAHYSQLALGPGVNAESIRNATGNSGWEILSGAQLLERGVLKALQDGNHGSQYPKASELGDVGYPYLSASDIENDGTIDLRRCRRIAPERAARLRIPPAQPGDVILCNNATVGRVARIPDWDTPIVASTSTTYYRPDEQWLHANFLRYYMESDLFQEQLRRVMKQSTRDQVPITTQKRLLFLVPPLSEQVLIVDKIDRIEHLRRATHRRLVEALQLKRMLLARVSGE